MILEKLPTQEEKGDQRVGLLLPRSRCPLLSLGKEREGVERRGEEGRNGREGEKRC